MADGLMLLGEIFLVGLLQMLMIQIIDPDKKKAYVQQLVDIAGFVISLTLILQFVISHLLGELSTVVRFPFI